MTIHTEPEEDVSTDIKTETAFQCFFIFVN